MLNIDWFQPFDNANYSIRAIYGVICNLSRNERFKPSNILTMALIPRPNESSLHWLNHYLAFNYLKYEIELNYQKYIKVLVNVFNL